MDPSAHIEERILEYLILEPQRGQGERSEIDDHLRECAGCAALYEEIREYYAEVSQLQSERANQAGRGLARREGSLL